MIIMTEEFIRLYKEKFKILHGRDLEEGSLLDKYTALAGLLKERIYKDWVDTNNLYHEQKQVYYFAMEFLPGKLLRNYINYSGMNKVIEEGLAQMGIELSYLEAMEYDAALGNGGLGRLGSCFLDSMASLGIAGHGCCLRYKYGLFRQKIVDGFQVELPENWLINGNAWEVIKPDSKVEVKFGGTVRTEILNDRLVFIHENYEVINAVPYDMPIIGYNNKIVNTLRLWQAEIAGMDLDMSAFTRDDYLKALEYKQNVEAISKILYPDDSNDSGKILRLKQQYFLASAGIQSIINYYKEKNKSLAVFADYVAIHLNDTHPVLCIPEMMRIFIDNEGLSWEESWQITTSVISYTNHTILPEALEKWPVDMLKNLLPRIYMIIEEINRRCCPSDDTAIISNGLVHMAHLAVIGSSWVNGVSKIHTELLKKQTLKRFYEVIPKKFSNKTNGVSHRRFLMQANPRLADLISSTIGTEWIKKPQELLKLNEFAADASFQEKFQAVRRKRKLILSESIRKKHGIYIDPESIFDVHMKRIHAYKRQLLNILHIMDLYNRLQEDPNLPVLPRTFIFAGKAAPGYLLAKKFIKLINTVADKVNSDKTVGNKLKVVFLDNYNVSLAELVIPAADVSEQISTAGKEASGTGNMKLMMNGAILIGTMDGANIEIREEVGAENLISFGLSVDEVLAYYQRGGYCAWNEYNQNARIKVVLDQLINGFLPAAKEEFRLIYDHLLSDNDEYFVLKDFTSYVEAQDKANELYKNRDKWLKMSIHNIAHSGKFSSDRAIAEYARDIWRVKAVKHMGE